jgi:hypothetical protein
MARDGRTTPPPTNAPSDGAANAGLPPVKRKVGPSDTAALSLVAKAAGRFRVIPIGDTSAVLARDVVRNGSEGGDGTIKVHHAPTPSPDEVPTLLLPIPSDHDKNRRDDQHTDYAELKAKGQVRDREGEIIEIKSLWQKWGAYRMDRFFQAYCKVVLRESVGGTRAVDATDEQGPIQTWVRTEAARLGMEIATAHRIIRDGCGVGPGKNSMWWRGVSVD